MDGSVSTVDNSGARRSRNKRTAFQLASVGLWIFPSDGKVPLVPRFHRADSSLSQTEIERAVEEYTEKHGQAPVHVGATRDPEVIKKLWRRYPDSVPSVSTGPSKLVCVDADAKDRGPENIRALFATIGGIPEGCPATPTRSGGLHIVFSDSESRFTNRAGALKRLGCDLRGVGGQFVAPGSLLENGKSYGSDEDRINFLRCIANKTLKPLPERLVELIGSAPTDAEGAQVTPTQEREVIKQLEEADREQHENDFDPTLGKYDIEKLRAENEDFAKLYDEPSSDCSTNRFLAARHVMREWPDMPAPALSAFFSQWAGAGEHTDDKPTSGQYDDRQVAREWIKNQGLKKRRQDFEFGAVEEEKDNVTELSEGEKEKTEKRSKKMLFKPTRLELNGINAISPRAFIYRKWLIKGAVTVLIAPGGRAKSSLTLSKAIDLACGVDHLGAKIVRPRSVFLYNAEDPIMEMERRAEAYMLFHDFTADEKRQVKQNLHLQSGAGGLLIFASADRSGVSVNEKLVSSMIDYIREHNIELVVLDPLVTLHTVPENDNMGMTHVADVFKRIAAETNVAMLIAHHARKTQRSNGAVPLDANDGRGAVAVINSARIVMNINDIPSPEKAAEFQITDQDLWRYIVVGTGDKTNLSARDQTVAVFRLNSVQADNATEEFEADNTVAISEHKFERVIGVSEDVTRTVLAALDGEAPVGSNPQHANYLGKLIADAAGWNLDLKSVRSSVKDIIAQWTRQRWIATATFESAGKGSERRKPVSVFVRGPVRPYEAVENFEAVEDEAA